MSEKKSQKEVSKYKLEAEKEKIENESLLKERSELEEKIKRINIESIKKDKDKRLDDAQLLIHQLQNELDKLNLMKPSHEQLASLNMLVIPTYQVRLFFLTQYNNHHTHKKELFRNHQATLKENKRFEDEITSVKKGAIDAIVEKQH